MGWIGPAIGLGTSLFSGIMGGREASRQRKQQERWRQEDLARNARYRQEEMDRLSGYRGEEMGRLDPRITEGYGDLRDTRDQALGAYQDIYNRPGFSEDEARRMEYTPEEQTGLGLREDEKSEMEAVANNWQALGYTPEEAQQLYYGEDWRGLYHSPEERAGLTYGQEGRGRMFLSPEERERRFLSGGEREGMSVSRGTREQVEMTPERQAMIRSLAVDPIGASAEAAQNELMRRASISGGYAPGLNATMEEIGRNRGRDASRAALEAELGIYREGADRALQLSDRDRESSGRIASQRLGAEGDIQGLRLGAERDIQGRDIEATREAADARMRATGMGLENRVGAARETSRARMDAAGRALESRERGARDMASARIGQVRDIAQNRFGAARDIGTARMGQQQFATGGFTNLSGQDQQRYLTLEGQRGQLGLGYSGQQTSAGLGYAGQGQEAAGGGAATVAKQPGFWSTFSGALDRGGEGGGGTGGYGERAWNAFSSMRRRWPGRVSSAYDLGGGNYGRARLQGAPAGLGWEDAAMRRRRQPAAYTAGA
jgi:hypothetical protein